MSDHHVQVQIGPQGTGWARVPHEPGQIELVRVLSHHGHPHVWPAAPEHGSLIEVLGALPDAEVAVTYRVPEES